MNFAIQGRDEMKWASLLNSVRPIFFIAYGVFVVWTVVRLIMEIRSFRRYLREWLGLIGLLAGICSAMLLALFYIHILAEGKLIAHGAALWIYYYTAICFALIGLALGLAGHGWVRRSSTIVSLVMVFQWSGQMVVSAREDFLITVAMFVSLAVVGIIFMASQRFTHADEGANGRSYGRK
jgi:hypothetical protein